MFGINSDKRLISIDEFNRDGASYTNSHLEDRMTKKEMLKRVSEWWDNHGTCFEDYDGIQVKFSFEKGTIN